MKKKVKIKNMPIKSYRTHVSANGRVNIPAKIRKMAALQEGEEVIFEVKNHVIYLTPLKQAIAEAQALAALTQSPRTLTEEWQLLRQEEIASEKQRLSNNGML